MWDDPEEFKPERFPLDGPIPNEQNTDYRYIPFSAGPRWPNTWPPLPGTPQLRSGFSTHAERILALCADIFMTMTFYWPHCGKNKVS